MTDREIFERALRRWDVPMLLSHAQFEQYIRDVVSIAIYEGEIPASARCQALRVGGVRVRLPRILCDECDVPFDLDRMSQSL
jgi:hypothetical protein